MKNNKSKTKRVARYGVALSSIFVANEIQADIETITWNGGQPNVVLSDVGSVDLDLDQLQNLISTGYGFIYTGFDFRGSRFTFLSCIGFGVSQACTSTTGSLINGVQSAIAGVGSFYSGEAIPQNLSGTVLHGPRRQFVGFVTVDGNQGWFRIDLSNGVRTYGSGQIATDGEDLIAGVFIGDDTCGAAVDLLNGVLTIEGTNQDDVIEVFQLNGNTMARLNDCAEPIAGPINEVVINGRAGDDEISVTLGNNKTIFGGAGDDTITVTGPGVANIFGEDGDDTIVGGSGPDVIRGGAGNDNLMGRGGADWLDAGAPIAGGSDMNIIEGGVGADTILGGEDIDVVIAGNGADTIVTFDGDDMINGDQGNDTIMAGAGNDTIIGGAANDFISGGAGNDDITGGPGQDNIFGGSGEDIITGGPASDIIQGGTDNDTISGNDGLDSLGGGPGDDTIYGGIGNDTISGGPGNDMLFGQTQHDIVNGDGGDDTLSGGPGFDQLIGGAGIDTADDTGEAGETGIEN